ncbi:MAG: hypothetical protein DDT19_01877 [Syntrophomonadaceae bacterium]|nr:hypothetical protein [Bacillota bacterium]
MLKISEGFVVHLILNAPPFMFSPAPSPILTELSVGEVHERFILPSVLPVRAERVVIAGGGDKSGVLTNTILVDKVVEPSGMEKSPLPAGPLPRSSVARR